MENIFISVLIWMPMLLNAQAHIGDELHFENRLNWEQVKEKAKRENKFIFVDCVATWCSPCKGMEKNVYSNLEVENCINEKFISIKLQVDTSGLDDEYVIKWYADSHKILEEYKITIFPSFLFFNSDGKIVHRGVGYQKASDFISLALDAYNPSKQYYTLLDKYKRGEKDFSLMPYIANTARKFNEDNLALYIAKDYMHNYLDKMNDSIFCTKSNLDFIASFYVLLNSKDRVFNLYYCHSDEVDSIMGDKGYCARFVNYIIYKEEVTSKIDIAKKLGVDPEWAVIRKNILAKYDVSYSIKDILTGKVEWYGYKRKWKKYTKYLAEKIERERVDVALADVMGTVYLNNCAWEVFRYSTKKNELRKALSWVELAMSMDSSPQANLIDTKANLLYKLGRKSDGVVFERKAIILAPGDKLIEKNLEKMKSGLPTWF